MKDKGKAETDLQKSAREGTEALLEGATTVDELLSLAAAGPNALAELREEIRKVAAHQKTLDTALRIQVKVMEALGITVATHQAYWEKLIAAVDDTGKTPPPGSGSRLN